MSEPKGWHSRGYLPHLDEPGLVQSVTFSLHDAVPIHVIARWKQELDLSETITTSDQRSLELRKRIAQFEDQGHGTCALQIARAAELVQNTLIHFD